MAGGLCRNPEGVSITASGFVLVWKLAAQRTWEALLLSEVATKMALISWSLLYLRQFKEFPCTRIAFF